MSAAGRCGKFLFIFAVFAPTAVAQQGWADALVDRRKVDFGVIATGSEAIETLKVSHRRYYQSVTGICQGFPRAVSVRRR